LKWVVAAAVLLAWAWYLSLLPKSNIVKGGRHGVINSEAEASEQQTTIKPQPLNKARDDEKGIEQ
jgi:hypothetical protein